MEGFTIYSEWVEMIEMLPQEKQMAALKAIADYCTQEVMPSKEDGLIYMLILGIKPAVDAQKQNIENGKKGGRPKKVVEETQKTPFSENKNSKNPLSELKTPFSEKKPPFSDAETEKEKDKENINYVDTKESEKERFSPSPSTALLPVSELEDAMMSSEAWVESMLYKYKLDKEQLAVQLHGFAREWIERGDDCKTLKDAKRHADALLRIRDGDGALAAAPHWNRFLADLCMKYVDELGYDYDLITAFGKYYMQDVGNGKPFFLGIPKFEENLFATMKAFKAEYKTEENECIDEPRSRSKPA